MLSFFKVNDPFRLLAVALYILLIGVVGLMVFPTGLTKPLLHYMVLGERMAEGFVLYKDILDDTAPLSAGVFALLDVVFGRSELAYQILGRVLILLHVIYWNSILIRYRVYTENTYLPAIIMAGLYQISFDLSYLSPQLLGSSFLILALGQLFSQTVLQKETSESTLLIGLYGGLAAGFHLNYLIFLPYLILSGIAISGFTFRQVMLSLVGFLVPILLILVFFYWKDALGETLSEVPLFFIYDKYAYLGFWQMSLFLAFPAVLALLGFLFSAIFKGSSVNQQKQRQLIILWMFFGVAEIILIKRQAPFQLGIFIPGLTYLIAGFFVNTGSNLLSRLAFGILLLGLPAAGWWFWSQGPGKDSTYFVGEVASIDPSIRDKSILVLDGREEYFLRNKLGGPFLNPNQTRYFLEGDLSLGEKSKIYASFYRQSPEVVIDQGSLFSDFLEDFPAIGVLYEKKDNGIYVLKK